MDRKENEKEGSVKKTPVLRRLVRILFKAVMLVLLLFVIFLIGLNTYLKSNETKVLSNLSILNNGSLSFESAKISVLKDFPHATISLKNVLLHDANFSSHATPILALEKLTLSTSLKEIWSREIEVQGVEFANGSVNLFVEKDGFNNLKSFLSEKTDDGTTQEASFLKVLTDNLNVSFTNVKFTYTNAIKTTSIHATLDDVSAQLHRKDKRLGAKIDMAIAVQELAFKKKKGSFIADSKLKGKFEIQVESGNITFEPFVLSINEEKFLFSGNYDTSKRQLTTLNLENRQTAWDKTIPLLPVNLRQKLEPFHIAQPFYSKTVITSHFTPGEIPLVNIQFRMDDENEVTAKGFLFKQVIASGHFTNRQFDDERSKLEDGKGIKIALINTTAIHDGFYIKIPTADITSSPSGGPVLKADLIIDGQPAGISKWLKNDKFFFKKGKFTLIASVDGSLKNFKQMVLDSEAKLVLKNFSVIYTPSNSAFPFKHLSLYKKSGDADFSIISSTLENGHDFQIDGGMINLKALLFAVAGRASSDVNFVAEKLSWSDFINLFGESGYFDTGKPKDDDKKKNSMKETIRGLQFQFQPRLSVAVDTLQYFDLLELHQFKTGVHFENEHTLVLEKTSFRYGEGQINFAAKLDISKEKRTPFEFELHAKNLNLAKLLPPFDYFNIMLLANMEQLPENVSVDIKHKGIIDDVKGLIPRTSTGEIIFKLDKGRTLSGKIAFEPATLGENQGQEKLGLGNSIKTKITLDGDPALFNNFFKTDRFFFDNGHFFSQFDYEGDVTNFQELLSNGSATFNLNNSDVFYKLSGVSYPLTAVTLKLKKDIADFTALMNIDSINQNITMTGKIQNLSELAIGNTGKAIKTVVDIKSPVIVWPQFVRTFSTNIDKPDEKAIVLKTTAKGIMSAFNPDLSVYLDTFIYSDKLMLYDVQTGISLKDSSTLVLDKTGFRFLDGSISLQGSVDLGRAHFTPFEGHFITDELDVAKLLESLDYLNIPSFKNIEKLSGRSTIDLELTSIIDELGKGFVPQATHGKLDFELNDIVVQGFAPLDEMAAKLLMKKRFKQLSFAPLANKLIIEGSEIYIPLMEVQSNAINMFIEGTYSYGNKTNLWISVPLDNLKSPKPSIIPRKRGYEATKGKIYIEVTADEQGNNKFKFHLSKKKFYKQRGIPEQHKIDKKNYRTLRKKRKEGN